MQSKSVSRVKKLWLGLLSPLLLLVGCGSEPSATWHMINVNTGKLQGDANLIQTGDSTIMIDGGYYDEAKQSLVPYLAHLGITKIDHFYVSHPHRDHYEGLRALLEANVTVSHLYLRIPPQHICDREVPWGCNMADITALVNEAKAHGISIHHPEAGFRYDFNSDSPEVCTNCNGNEVENCSQCDGESLTSCEECFGDGEVEVDGSAMVSTLSLYSFNPRIFNSLELITGNNNNVVNDDIYDKILKDKLSCITYLEYEDYEFIESDFEWAEEGQIILESLSLI